MRRERRKKKGSRKRDIKRTKFDIVCGRVSLFAENTEISAADLDPTPDPGPSGRIIFIPFLHKPGSTLIRFISFLQIRIVFRQLFAENTKGEADPDPTPTQIRILLQPGPG